MRPITTLLLAFMAASCVLPAARAAGFPDRPVTVVIPFPPGGPTDAIARALTADMKQQLGQPMTFAYHPGANGNIGAEFVARAPADGYTLLLGTSGPLATNAALYPKLGYDPVKSFVPVIHAGDLPSVLLVNPSVPAGNVAALIAHARANPGKLSYASSGNGAIAHLAGVRFNAMAGVDLRHVPYKGTAPALNDLLAGQVDISFTDVLTALPLVKAGRLRALGVASTTRSAALPQVPTIAEQGLKDFDARVFFVIVAPAGTPEDRVQTLRRAFAAVLASPRVQEQFAAQGVETPPATTPDQLAGFIPAQVRILGAVVRQYGVQID